MTSLVTTFANKYGIKENNLLQSLKNTAFRQTNGEVTNDQMMALLVVANEYNLNPWTKEIYAFPDKNKGIVPIVGVDGWSRIINENKNFNGMTFRESDDIIKSKEHKDCPAWIECSIYRKDREYPTVIKEYFDEVYRPPIKPRGKDYVITGPWQTHPKRFLRHKAMIQCSRLAFAYTGIYDQDEGERIIEAEVIRDEPEFKPPRIDQHTKDEFYNQVVEAINNCDDLALQEIYQGWDQEELLVLTNNFNSTQRRAISTALAGLRQEEKENGQS